jgi:prephenate dehydrogenase
MLGKTVINKEKHEQDIFDMAGSGLKVPFVLQKFNVDAIFKQNKVQVVRP